MKKFTVIYQDASENEDHEEVEATHVSVSDRGVLVFANENYEPIRAYAPGWWHKFYLSPS